jgi:hypothetical protein
VTEKRAATVATSKADDLAFGALADVCQLTVDLDVRVVGGQMVSLLLTAFPTPAAVFRRTADADAAVTTEVAASGEIHKILSDAGYDATDGNSYEKHGRRIDLLVPAPANVFKTEIISGRAFDAAPGVRLALATEPIAISATVRMTEGQDLRFSARVPTVECALVIKALAYSTRLAVKDLADIHNLLQLVEKHGYESIGGWRLASAGDGARSDAQRALHEIADRLARSRRQSGLNFGPEVLVALIRKHVAKAE